MRRIARHLCRSHCLALALLAAAALAGGPAAAQYKFNPANADEQIGKGPRARYFGSVKDEQGRPVPGAMIVVHKAYVFMSDPQGRFAGFAPPRAPTIGCSKRGYRDGRVVQRPGSTGPRKWVQADCVLRRA